MRTRDPRRWAMHSSLASSSAEASTVHPTLAWICER